jgi:hypothetical protein
MNGKEEMAGEGGRGEMGVGKEEKKGMWGVEGGRGGFEGK